eukprot:COSAG01_NODE_26643_length_707_cov_1.861842_1_plen_183_part_10
MTQRDFMLAALQADEDLRPKQVIQFWQQRKTIESAEQLRTYTLPDGTTAEYKVKTAFQYFDDLTDEQLKALTDGYYRELRGSVGMRGFWEWFNRNNPQQRQSGTPYKVGMGMHKSRGAAAVVVPDMSAFEEDDGELTAQYLAEAAAAAQSAAEEEAEQAAAAQQHQAAAASDANEAEQPPPAP